MPVIKNPVGGGHVRANNIAILAGIAQAVMPAYREKKIFVPATKEQQAEFSAKRKAEREALGIKPLSKEHKKALKAKRRKRGF